jgi:hypothetical protein
MSSTAETTTDRPATPAPEREAIRAFLGRALADDALDDEVKQLLFDHVVEERLDRPALTEGLAREFGRLIDAARPEDWQAVSDDLVAEAREVVAALQEDGEAAGRPEGTTTERPPLRFIDHHRQHYAGKVPIAEAGEFIIGSYHEDGSLDEDGEFRVTLHALGAHRDRWALTPRLEAFGDGNGALQRALDAGLLEALGPVAGREEFAQRLLALGILDRSDNPLPGTGTEA